MPECPDILFREALMCEGRGMVHIDFFTEEESARVALYSLLPRMLPESAVFDIFAFQGKGDLLKKLPKRLRAYRHPPLNTHKVIVLIDRDTRDCQSLKQELELIAREAGIVSKTENPNDFQIVTRIVIEELEAWYFGDVTALHEAFSCVSKTICQRRGFENPDEVAKPSKRLLKLLQSEYPGASRLPKIEVAERVSAYMNPKMNMSRSFQVFYEGVKACCDI